MLRFAVSSQEISNANLTGLALGKTVEKQMMPADKLYACPIKLLTACFQRSPGVFSMQLCRCLGWVVLVAAALPLSGQKGPKRLWIRPSDQLLGFNGQLPYAATLAFFRGIGQQGGERDVTADITWSSSNPNLVAIDPHTGVATSGGASGTV